MLFTIRGALKVSPFEGLSAGASILLLFSLTLDISVKLLAFTTSKRFKN
jgi:hypothetical protein